MIIMILKQAINDFEWVLRLLESSETKEQMDTVLTCFDLWEKKHLDKTVSKKDVSTLKKLKLNFWELFKNKNIRFFNVNMIK